MKIRKVRTTQPSWIQLLLLLGASNHHYHIISQTASVSASTTKVQITMKDKIQNAITGAFVGDAASMGTHWYYDPNEMKEQVPSVDKPEFKDPPNPKFYAAPAFPGHYDKVGMLSPYGEQLLFATEYVASDKTVDGAAMSKAMYDWAKSFGGRPDGALKDFIANMEKENDEGKWPNCGADDSQAHCFTKAIPVACLYAGTKDMDMKVAQAIRVHQNNDEAVAFGIASAKILEAVLLGSSVQEAIAKSEAHFNSDAIKSNTKIADTAKEAVRGAFASAKKESEGTSLDAYFEAAGMKGRSCAMPSAFVVSLYLLYKNDEKSSDFYTSVLRQNILSSGDTCSRAIFLGSVMGAASAPTQEWVDKLDATVKDKVSKAASAIAENQPSVAETCAV